MKTLMKKIISGMLVVCMVSVLLCVPALARSSEYLDAYGATLTPKSGGKIVVTVDVEAVRKMDKVGASEINIYESTDGIRFDLVKTYTYGKYPAMMGSGLYYYEDPVTYNGTPGNQYFALVYCYAGDATGHDEKSYTTATKTAIE